MMLLRTLSAFVLYSLLANFAFAADPVRMIAHRGGVVDEQTIENNRASIEEAVRRGYWMLEVDVRRTRDGVPIAHHDAHFRRYYEDSRRVTDLTWDEVSQLVAEPSGERPLKLDEYLGLCAGRVRIMLDVKGEKQPLPESYLAEIERVMTKHGLLESAYMIGTPEAKAFFRGKLRISGKYEAVLAARERGEDIRQLYFLFPRGRKFAGTAIADHLALGIPVVPSINTFHYPSATRQEQGLADIRRLRAAGVTEFQIDSVYDAALRDEE